MTDKVNTRTVSCVTGFAFGATVAIGLVNNVLCKGKVPFGDVPQVAIAWTSSGTNVVSDAVRIADTVLDRVVEGPRPDYISRWYVSLDQGQLNGDQ